MHSRRNREDFQLFCLQCGAPLEEDAGDAYAAVTLNCPQCNRPYDPNDASTVATDPTEGAVQRSGDRALKRAGTIGCVLPIVAIALILAFALVWAFVGWLLGIR